MGVRAINLELCNGCAICVEDCPTEIFKVDLNNKKAYIAYPEDCGECKLCPGLCPSGAIDFTLDVGSKLFFPY